MKHKRVITIIIKGGAAQWVEGLRKNDSIEIRVKDYDTDGVDTSVLNYDEHGDSYQLLIFDPSKW